MLLLGIISISVGLIYGISLSLIFKHLRFLTISPIIETFSIFAFCYMSYFTSNLIKLPSGLEMSGIISLLTCAIVSAHYTYYNISPQGKQASTLSFSFIGEMAEAAVYSYIGLALYSTIPTWWSWSFIFI
jgi:NhaP-type Na+/H+ or K+/H+ antiporter